MHIDEIRILLADKCLDVLAIQETKLDVFNNNSDFYICSYKLIQRDTLSNGGGGICFYINPFTTGGLFRGHWQKGTATLVAPLAAK